MIEITVRLEDGRTVTVGTTTSSATDLCRETLYRLTDEMCVKSFLTVKMLQVFHLRKKRKTRRAFRLLC